MSQYVQSTINEKIPIRHIIIKYYKAMDKSENLKTEVK